MSPRDEYIDELLSAYLDGALTPDEAARAEQLVRDSEVHRQTLEDLRRFRGRLRQLPQYELPADFHQRVLAKARAEAAEPHRPASLPAADAQRHPWRRLALFGASLAAAGLLAVFGYHQMPGRNVPPHIVRELPRETEQPDSGRNGPRDDEAAPIIETTEILAANGSDSDVKGLDNGPGQPEAVSAETRADSTNAVVTVEPPIDDGGTAAPVEELPLSDPNPRVAVQQRQVDAAWPEMEAFVAQQSKVAPQPKAVAEDSGKLVFVVHLTLTSEGVRNRTFERVLRDHAIWLDNAIPLDERTEKLLLDNRFIAGAERAASDQSERSRGSGVGLVYVEATALQIDFSCRELAAMRSDVKRVQYDFTPKPSQLDVFRQLHHDAVHLSAREAAMQPAQVVDRGGPQMTTLPRGSARAILPADMPQGVDGYLGAFPEPVAAPEGADAVPMMIDVAPVTNEQPAFVPTVPVTPVDEHQVSYMNPIVHTLFVLKLAE